jgi:glycosyltransferase involved in cell wall biosynthesis
MALNVKFRSHAQLDTLLAPANPERDPEGLITKYVEFEFNRSRMYEHYDLFGSKDSRLRALFWYLTATSRPKHSTLPLSGSQIAFLNSTLPMLGRKHPLSVAVHSFAEHELPGLLAEDTEEALIDLAYWWCVERSPALAAGGALTPPDLLAVLTRIDLSESRAKYSLNRFCILHARVSPRYQGLDLSRSVDRVVFLASLFLEAGEAPHLALLMPSSALLALSKAQDGGRPSILDQVLQHGLTAHSAGDEQDPEAGADLRRTIFEIMDRAANFVGASATTRAWSTHSYRPSTLKSEAMAEGVTLIGPLTAASGLGQATRLSLEALKASGEDVSALDFVWGNPAAKGAGPSATKPVSAPNAINLIHLNAESLPPVFSHLDPVLYENSYNIGFFYWELDVIPRCHMLALEMLDEVWVSSAYNREIYSRYTDKPVIEMGVPVQPLPDITGATWEEFGLEGGPFTFLTTFDSFSYVQRKNPVGVIRAFQLAFPVVDAADVRLILKTQNRRHVSDPAQSMAWAAIDQAISEDPRIILLDNSMPYKDVMRLKSLANCYVSLHRSEGWGFGIIEAMQLGVPVIATGYSGNMSFCSDENAYLVEFDLVTVSQADYIYVEPGSLWAEPRVTHAAHLMRELASIPIVRRGKSATASAIVGEIATIQAVSRRYAKRVVELREQFINECS